MGDSSTGEDEFANPKTRGEKRLDPNLTGIEFGQDGDDINNYDTGEFHYPEPEDGHLNANNTSALSADAHGSEEVPSDDEFDDENYSDILGDMSLQDYLGKFAGHNRAPADDANDLPDSPEGEDFQDDQELDGDEDFQDDETDQDPEGLESEEGEEDPDFQGVIRTVKGAVLVYKRADVDGTFSELWVYNVGEDNLKDQSKIRRAILSGTDISPQTETDESGDQTAETSSVGNVQFLRITGLPS